MLSFSFRIWLAGIGLLMLFAASLFLIGSEIVAPNLKAHWPYLATIVFAWAFSIPNIGRVRRMIADEKLGLK